MEASSPPAAMAAVIDELTKARQTVAVLSTLLVDQPESPAARFLLEAIMSAISKAISVLESDLDSMEAQLDSLSSDITSMAPGEKRKMQSTRKSATRKRGNPYLRSKITSAIVEDGYTWRKYGQKEILSAKHPRSYFRCTYRMDRGCRATKQVQKSEDDPFLYVINYFGDHTCTKNNSRCSEPHPFSFKLNGIEAEIPFSSFPSNQQEIEEEVVSNPTSCNTFSECFEPSEMELQKPLSIVSEYDWNDSSLGLISSITSDDLEFMDLEKILCFDDNIELLTW